MPSRLRLLLDSMAEVCVRQHPSDGHLGISLTTGQQISDFCACARLEGKPDLADPRGGSDFAAALMTRRCFARTTRLLW